jgi:hypothetical protein
MGPKKAAAKPKKKEGNPEEGKELDDKEFKELYLRTAVSLQLQLGMGYISFYVFISRTISHRLLSVFS